MIDTKPIQSLLLSIIIMIVFLNKNSLMNQEARLAQSVEHETLNSQEWSQGRGFEPHVGRPLSELMTIWWSWRCSSINTRHFREKKLLRSSFYLFFFTSFRLLCISVDDLMKLKMFQHQYSVLHLREKKLQRSSFFLPLFHVLEILFKVFVSSKDKQKGSEAPKKFLWSLLLWSPDSHPRDFSLNSCG